MSCGPRALARGRPRPRRRATRVQRVFQRRLPTLTHSRLIARRLAIVLVLVVVDLWSKEVVFDLVQRLSEQGQLVADPCERGHFRVPLVGD